MEEFDFSLCDVVPDEVVANIDVLSTLVVNFILCHVTCTFVVDVDGHRHLHWEELGE